MLACMRCPDLRETAETVAATLALPGAGRPAAEGLRQGCTSGPGRCAVQPTATSDATALYITCCRFAFAASGQPKVKGLISHNASEITN